MESKKDKLIKIGESIKKRREALGKSAKEVAQESGISATLISQLENFQRENIPKNTTLSKLEQVLKYQNMELVKIAIENAEPSSSSDINDDWKLELREFLATKLLMNSENVQRSVHYIQGLILVQAVEEQEWGGHMPELKEKLQRLGG